MMKPGPVGPGFFRGSRHDYPDVEAVTCHRMRPRG